MAADRLGLITLMTLAVEGLVAQAFVSPDRGPVPAAYLVAFLLLPLYRLPWHLLTGLG